MQGSPRAWRTSVIGQFNSLMLPFACSSFGRFAPSTAFDPLNNYVFPTCLLEPSPHAYTGDGFNKRQFTVYY